MLQYFGGTNFGRTAGGPLQITSYDYDAPIDEYGMQKNNNYVVQMVAIFGIHITIDMVEDVQLMNLVFQVC